MQFIYLVSRSYCRILKTPTHDQPSSLIVCCKLADSLRYRRSCQGNRCTLAHFTYLVHGTVLRGPRVRGDRTIATLLCSLLRSTLLVTATRYSPTLRQQYSFGTKLFFPSLKRVRNINGHPCIINKTAREVISSTDKEGCAACEHHTNISACCTHRMVLRIANRTTPYLHPSSPGCFLWPFSVILTFS